MTRSLFSLKPPGLPPPRPPGAPPPAPVDEPASEDVSERVLSKLRGASQALPPSVTPGSVRAIRPGQLVRVLTEALAPEKRRFEEELARARQRTRELEGELDRVREERKDVDDTRRVELPRLAALVDQERTRVEALERERDAFTQRIAELEADVARRETMAVALESAMAPEQGGDGVADTLTKVKERLDSLAARPQAAPAPSPAEPTHDAAHDAAHDGAVVEALLSSDARALRIAALEQRLAELTGHAASLPGADEPPAARAVAALVRASQEEARARADRLEGQVGELLEVVRSLHGALGEEARRRSLVEGALRAAQARLALVERHSAEHRQPRAPLPSFTSLVRDGVRGDIGPMLDALREESRQREDALEARVQRLSLATRAALERMAEILDQALVAGLFDRDVPRLDKEAVGAPITEAVSDGPPTRADWDTRAWRHSLDALDAPDRDDEDEDDERDDDPEPDPDDEPDDRGPGGGHTADDGDDETGDAGDGAPLLARNGKSSRSPRGPWHDASEAGAFVEELADEPEESVAAEELEAWFRPGRPGQTAEEREAEQLSQFELEPPPIAPADVYDARLLGREVRARDPTTQAAVSMPTPPPPQAASSDAAQLEQLDRDQVGALRLPAELEAERERLERRVRDAERALESEVWRGLATHRELVTTRLKLDELEAKLVEPAPTLGGFEPISAVRPDAPALLSAPSAAAPPPDDRSAVLTLDVEERDSWVHWLLLENDPLFLDHRARALRQCADALRSPPSRPVAEDGDDRREELLHWLEAEP